jgi:hypothetical protein
VATEFPDARRRGLQLPTLAKTKLALFCPCGALRSCVSQQPPDPSSQSGVL